MKALFAAPLFVVGVFLSPATVLAAAPNTGAQTRALFKQHCVTCHGVDGKADTPVGKAVKASDLLSPQVQKKTDAELTEVIENGKQKMPTFKAKLKPQQVKELVEYIRELGKPETAGQK